MNITVTHEIESEEDRSNTKNSETHIKMEYKSKEELLEDLYKIKKETLDIETSDTLNASQKSMNLRHLRKVRREVEAAIKEKVLLEAERKFNDDKTRTLNEKEYQAAAVTAKNTSEKAKDTLQLTEKTKAK